MRHLTWVSGIRVVRFKFRLDSGGLTLRRCRLGDANRLNRLFRYAFFQTGLSGGGRQMTLLDMLRFRIWLRHTFQWVYIITRPTRRSDSILGFIGIYDLKIGRHAMLSIAIFDPLDRGLGYGTRALRTLLADFRRRMVFKSIKVEVSRRNSRSLAFFHKLGFTPVGGQKQ